MTLNSVFFKKAASKGALVYDYQVMRNVAVLVVSLVQMSCSGLSPFRDFPWTEKKWRLFWRCATGQIGFLTFNFCLSLVPLTIQMIIFQTMTFWVSVLAFLSFGEKIIPLELMAMFVCFGAMVTITCTGSKKDAASSNYESAELIVGYILMFVCSWVIAACTVLCRALKEINIAVIMFWHGVMGLSIAIICIGIDYAVNRVGSGEGLQLFNYSKEVYLLLLAATLGDTIGVNFGTVAF